MKPRGPLVLTAMSPVLAIVALTSCSSSTQPAEPAAASVPGSNPSPTDSLLPPAGQIQTTVEPGEEFATSYGARCRVDEMKYGRSDPRGRRDFRVLVVMFNPEDSRYNTGGCYAERVIDSDGRSHPEPNLLINLAKRGKISRDWFNFTVNEASPVTRVMIKLWKGGRPVYLDVPSDVPTIK